MRILDEHILQIYVDATEVYCKCSTLCEAQYVDVHCFSPAGKQVVSLSYQHIVVLRPGGGGRCVFMSVHVEWGFPV